MRMSLNLVESMRLPLLALPLLIGGCTAGIPTTTTPPTPEPQVGVLVMAHGGSTDWDRAIEVSVGPLAKEVPLEIAFGMANPTTLSSGLESLRARGVDRVALVRLFLSGTSFLHQTEYLLRLRADRPRWFVTHGEGHGADPEPIDHGLELKTHADGLSEAPALRTVVADRVAEVSQTPAKEAVLLLAHGVGDDVENAQLLERMAEAMEGLTVRGFAEVRASTLREDWEEKRALAEAEIRTFVATQSAEGHRVIVVPYRLFGSGPYADVLSGLDYEMTRSLVPHTAVEDWVRVTASRLMCQEGWRPATACPSRIAPRD